MLTRRPSRFAAAAAILIALAGVMGNTVAAADPPSTDPYPHKVVKRREYGQGPLSYWLFEPADPAPRIAPVIVFNHGWLAVNPAIYGAWIDHLTRSGSIVIFPRYQTDAFTRPVDFLPNAITAVRDALDVLQTATGHVRPDLRRFAAIGHSAGGNLAAMMAATAAESQLPPLRAVIVMMPGEVQPVPEPTLDRIPAETLLVVAAAEEDRLVGDARAREIFSQATAVPKSRKKYILYRTDIHGTPRLIANHVAPTCNYSAFDNGDGLFAGFQRNLADINAFDRAGFWFMADLTLRAAFSGQTLDAASNHGDAFRHLGFWSDGRPVTPPIVSDDLSLVPRVVPSNGIRLIRWGAGSLVAPELRPPDPPQGEALSEAVSKATERR